MLTTYMVLTCNRKDDLKKCLDSIIAQRDSTFEIVVVSNNSTDGTAEMMEKLYPSCKYIEVGYNSGICTGRNIGFSHSQGDIIVVLDDDCEVADRDFNSKLQKKMIENPDWGILSFHVINTRSTEYKGVIPSKDKSIVNREVEVTYFPGGAHVIRKKLLEEIGTLPDEYFYSMEELDMGYRVMSTHWKIYFTPDLWVYHHESPQSRPSWRRFYYDFRNRIWLTTKYLPVKYIISQLILWGGYTFLKSIRYGYVKYFFRSIRDALQEIEKYKELRRRYKLDGNAIQRLKKLNGRLYY